MPCNCIIISQKELNAHNHEYHTMIFAAGNSFVYMDPYGDSSKNSIILQQYYDYILAIFIKTLKEHPEITLNIVFDSVNVFFGNHLHTIHIFVNYEHCFYYDEQHKIHTRIENPFLFERCDAIVNYSFANTHHLSLDPQFETFAHKNILVSPAFFDPGFARIVGGMTLTNRNVDVLTTFFQLSPRRQTLCAQLQAMPYTYKNETSTFATSKLCVLLSSAKILVNARQTIVFGAIEEIRILPAILCGCIVICEHGSYADTIPYKDFVIWCNIEDIPATTQKILNNYSETFASIFLRPTKQGTLFCDMYDQLVKSNADNILRIMRLQSSPHPRIRLATLPNIWKYRYSTKSVAFIPDDKEVVLWKGAFPHAQFETCVDKNTFAVVDYTLEVDIYSRLQNMLELLHAPVIPGNEVLELYILVGIRLDQSYFLPFEFQNLLQIYSLHTDIIDPNNIPVTILSRFKEYDIEFMQHNYGFFSTCSVMLHSISKFVNIQAQIPTSININQLFNWYKLPGNIENISHEFFEPQHCASQYAINTIHAPRSSKFALFRHWHQFTDYATIDFNHTNPLIAAFFTPSKEILQIKHDIMHKYNMGCGNNQTSLSNVCAVFFRGNDKRTETRVPEYHELISVAARTTDTVFIVQSDETDFIDAARTAFGDRMIVFSDEIRHMRRNDRTTVDLATPATNNFFVKRFFAITLIMADCNHIVCTTGNCSLWIALYRGSAINMQQI